MAMSAAAFGWRAPLAFYIGALASIALTVSYSQEKAPVDFYIGALASFDCTLLSGESTCRFLYRSVSIL